MPENTAMTTAAPAANAHHPDRDLVVRGACFLTRRGGQRGGKAGGGRRFKK
jgi:hypothetical protein